jgi:hypothetical protein
MIIFVGFFLNFLAFWPFPWQRRWTNFVAVAMETKKGGFKKNLDSFHQTS